MPREDVEIRIADRAQDKQDILRLREMVYVNEQGRIGRAEDLGASFDKYDRFATYFIARADGAAVGTTRVIADSPIGLPCERGADISAMRSNSRLVEVGHCITVPALRWKGIGLKLMRVAFEFSAKQLRATHILVDFFVDKAPAGTMKFHRAMGFKPLGEPYFDSRFKNSPASVVAVLAVEEALGRFRSRPFAGQNSPQARH